MVTTITYIVYICATQYGHKPSAALLMQWGVEQPQQQQLALARVSLFNNYTECESYTRHDLISDNTPFVVAKCSQPDETILDTLLLSDGRFTFRKLTVVREFATCVDSTL